MLNASVHLNRAISTTITLFKQQKDVNEPFVLLKVSDCNELDFYITNSNAARVLAHELNQSADVLDTANASAAQPCA